MPDHIVLLSDAESRRLATGTLFVVRPCEWQECDSVIPLPAEVKFEAGSMMTFPGREPHHWLFHNGIPIRDYEWTVDANPLGAPGDVLVCKEAWAVSHVPYGSDYECPFVNVTYRAGEKGIEYSIDRSAWERIYRILWQLGDIKWNAASTMPLWAVRHRPVVKEAGVMRVRDIEWQQAVEAGVVPNEYLPWVYSCLPNCLAHPCDRVPDGRTLCEKYNQGDSDETTVFGMQWDRKYAKKGLGWDANPWVWWARAEEEHYA